MKPVRCNNCRLFYDSEKHTQCPHCHYSPAPRMQENEEEKIDVRVADVLNIVTDNEAKKEILTKKQSDENNFTPHSAVNPPHIVAVAVAKPAEPEIVDELATQKEPFVPEKPDVPAEPAVASDLPLPDVKADDNFSVSISNCTVGWLVCLKGEYFGKSFVLKPGHNSVGRDSEMQVSLPEEKSILNQNHATIVYNYETNRFRFNPGDARGLTYLNDELKVSECDLRAGDIISIGKTSFIFVPLCGSRFKWDEYVK